MVSLVSNLEYTNKTIWRRGIISIKEKYQENSFWMDNGEYSCARISKRTLRIFGIPILSFNTKLHNL